QLPDGTIATVGGIYEQILQTVFGCDSVVSLELEMLPEYHFEFDHQICDDSFYQLPDGEEVNESGSYTVSFISQNGCDSTYTINLTVEPVISITEEVNLCQGQTHILPDGTEVNTEGIYEVVVSGAECDSVFEVTLIINPVYNLQFDAEICAEENYTLPDGSIVNMGGLYNSNLETVSGCDSIIDTFLIVHELPELS